MSSIDDVIHFFEMEIANCRDRMFRETVCFNGVQVGIYAAEILNQAYINFCQNAIDRIRSDGL